MVETDEDGVATVKFYDFGVELGIGVVAADSAAVPPSSCHDAKESPSASAS